MRVIIFLFCLLFALPLSAVNPSVVIVGGGPAGLATAIEAHEKGLEVTVVEKRTDYSRKQGVFLFDTSLRLLEKWQVDMTPITVVDIGGGERIGVVVLKELEEKLDARLQAKGIRKIVGECLGVSPDKRTACIVSDGRLFTLAYDIIVAADGSHSQIRKALGIEINNLGKASAISGLVMLPHQKMEITEAIQKDDIFIKKISTPVASIIFAQSETKKELSLEQIALLCGWQEELALIRAGEAHVLTGIEVVLQQAATFSDREKGAILVGDAAASASFLEGRGANTAFLTAECAGNFFEKCKACDPQAFDAFNAAMKKTTDELIDDSRYLFSPP